MSAPAIIVMGADVRVATVAVAQATSPFSIFGEPAGSQPNRSPATNRGDAANRVGVTEDGKKVALVKDGVSFHQLVDVLNGLGHRPARPDQHSAGDHGRPERSRPTLRCCDAGKARQRSIAAPSPRRRSPISTAARTMTSLPRSLRVSTAGAQRPRLRRRISSGVLTAMFLADDERLNGEGPVRQHAGHRRMALMLTDIFESFAKALGVGISNDGFDADSASPASPPHTNPGGTALTRLRGGSRCPRRFRWHQRPPRRASLAENLMAVMSRPARRIERKPSWCRRKIR